MWGEHAREVRFVWCGCSFQVPNQVRVSQGDRSRSSVFGLRVVPLRTSRLWSFPLRVSCLILPPFRPSWSQCSSPKSCRIYLCLPLAKYLRVKPLPPPLFAATVVVVCCRGNPYRCRGNNRFSRVFFFFFSGGKVKSVRSPGFSAPRRRRWREVCRSGRAPYWWRYRCRCCGRQ